MEYRVLPLFVVFDNQHFTYIIVIFLKINKKILKNYCKVKRNSVI